MSWRDDESPVVAAGKRLEDAHEQRRGTLQTAARVRLCGTCIWGTVMTYGAETRVFCRSIEQWVPPTIEECSSYSAKYGPMSIEDMERMAVVLDIKRPLGFTRAPEA